MLFLYIKEGNIIKIIFKVFEREIIEIIVVEILGVFFNINI